MKESKELREYAVKFNELTEANKRYIMAVQQALIYAQDVENRTREKQGVREVFH